jgi:dUTP pyrophosphatase
MALCYLAEPIDAAHRNLSRTMDDMAAALKIWGANTYRAAKAFHCPELDPRVDQINRQVLYRCDVIVAYLDTKTPSIGVPSEIEAATARGIPAVVHYTGTSFVLAGNPLVTVIDHPSSVVQAVEHALKNLSDRDDRIRVVLVDGGDLPIRKYVDDAGLDLTTAIDVEIKPGEFRDIRTQVKAVELPPGYWGMITGRSSTLRKHGLHVPMAVIDPGWRGPLFVGVWNLSPNPVMITAGNRLGQLICLPNHPHPVVSVDTVTEAPRGLNGFGSSGA